MDDQRASTQAATTPPDPEAAHVRPDVISIIMQRIATGILELVREIALDPEGAGGRRDEIRLETPFSMIEHHDWMKSIELWGEHGTGLIAGLPDRPCPACASDHHERIFQSFDGYPFHECRSCGTWFVPKRIDTSLFEAFFAACPEARTLAEQITRTRLGAEQQESDVARVSAYLRDLEPYLETSIGGRSYLDIGCNVGHSLTAAAAAGFTAHGVDTDEDAVAIARAHGLSVSMPGASLPSLAYSVMSLWETIEHIEAPRDVLAMWLPALAQGGVLALTFPNLNAPPVRLLRAECPYVFGGVNTPGHVNLFHVNGIRTLLESIGLRLLDADGQYGMNRRELALFAVGRHRGIYDYLTGTNLTHAVPELAIHLDNAIGPPMAVAERLLLLSPILRIVACRAEDYDRLAPIAARVQETRRYALAEEAGQFLTSFGREPTSPAPSAAEPVAP